MVCNFYKDFISPEVYDQCLYDAHPNVVNFLYFLAMKYADPNKPSKIDYSETSPVINDGVCNRALNTNVACGSAIPFESCINDPQDCGCPVIANISDTNITSGLCNPLSCTNGVCQPGACDTTAACQYNCNSAHYGGSWPYSANCGGGQSVAVDFAAPTAAVCRELAKWSDDICISGVNWISYNVDTPNALHVSRVMNCSAYPDGMVNPNPCP